MRVVVQEVEVRWTKASLCPGAEAAVRAAIPPAFALPEEVARSTGDAGDRRVVLEWRSFRVEPSELVDGAFARRFELERPAGDGGALVVRFDDTRGRRDLRAGSRGKVVFTLAPGEWGRVLHNHRESHERGDVYVSTTFSIGWFAGAAATDVFLGVPSHTHRALVSLDRGGPG